MSTTSKIFQDRPRVIAKAYRGEPAQVRALIDLGDVVEVFGKKEDTTIGLPREVLFRFDEELFKNLRNAFEAGDQSRLQELWSKASRFDDSGGAQSFPRTTRAS